MYHTVSTRHSPLLIAPEINLVRLEQPTDQLMRPDEDAAFGWQFNGTPIDHRYIPLCVDVGVVSLLDGSRALLPDAIGRQLSWTMQQRDPYAERPAPVLLPIAPFATLLLPADVAVQRLTDPITGTPSWRYRQGSGRGWRACAS